MLKKYILTALMLIVTAMCLHAQIAVGDWHIFPQYGSDFKKIIETKNNLFFLGSGNLYSYADDELTSYTKRNKLSDTNISDIFYNHEKDYLVIVYSNSNIDVLYGNGSLVNIPDLANTTLSCNKTINAVSFSGDYMYVATEFGYMVINQPKHEIKESHMLNVGVSGVAVAGSKLLLATGNNLYLAQQGSRITSLDSFTGTTGIDGSGEILPLGSNTFLLYTWRWNVGHIADNGNISISPIEDSSNAQVRLLESGAFVSPNVYGSPKILRYLSADGELAKSITVAGESSNSIITTGADSGIYWKLSESGLSKLKIDNDGAVTVLSEPFRPNACTVSNPSVLVYNKRLGNLLVMNQAETKFTLGYDGLGGINLLDNMEWKDITPESVPTRGDATGKLGLPYSPVFDPVNPEILYFGTWYNGVYKIDINGNLLAHYSYHNAPFQGYADGWMYNAAALQFDKDNNLWVIESEVGGKSVMMLPRAALDANEVTASNWYSYEIPGFSSNHRNRFLITTKGNVKLMSNGMYDGPLVAFDENGTPDNNADDRAVSYATLTDQDGNSFTWSYITYIAEDNNGTVWLGTDNGIVTFNPANIFNANFSVTRVKVPRNDGTNYADYLLEGNTISSIAVDGSNRKWIGTERTGVFLVSPDGTSILNTLTTANSYLPSNNIYSVACNSTNNSVYFATDKGLAEYGSDSSPVHEDFSDIYAYPNPVRPEFTGVITITGLMDDSLVKIADISGNIVFSGKSNGGMITWDGCNAAGVPVRGGIYPVFVSSSSGSSSSGAVTKILIVR